MSSQRRRLTNMIVTVTMIILTRNRRSDNGGGSTEHCEKTKGRGELLKAKEVDEHDAEVGVEVEDKEKGGG